MVSFAVISDTHLLHERGLTHPYVADCLTKFITRIPKHAVGIINGDLFQGVDMRWIAELKLGTAPEEIMRGRDILQKFYDACSVVYSTSGTRSHSSAGLDIEAVLSKFFGSKEHKVQLYIKDKTTGWRFLFQHGQSGALIYKESILRRELRFAHEKAWEGKMPHIDCLVRSHLHEYHSISSIKDKACMTPCFQLPTNYSESSSLGWKPDIGGLIIHLRESDSAEHGIQFEPISYGLPKEFMEVIEV